MGIRILCGRQAEQFETKSWPGKPNINLYQTMQTLNTLPSILCRFLLRTPRGRARTTHSIGSFLSTAFLAGAALLGGVGGGISQAVAGNFPSISTATDEQNVQSMGVYRVTVLSKFQPMFAGGTIGANTYAHYYGYTVASGQLTSPALFDNGTWIGLSATHCLDIGGSPLTLATPGVPCSVIDAATATASYSEITGTPTTPPFPFTGTYNEAFTYMINLQLKASSNCIDPTITQIPAPYDLTDPLVYTGLQNYPSIHKSIGRMVAGTPGSICSGTTAAYPGGYSDFSSTSPAYSFFDVYMNAFIPNGPGTDVPAGGFYLYNDPNDPNLGPQPLIVQNTDVESLPPALYKHGGTLYAVPVKMLNAGQDAAYTASGGTAGISWQAGETFGMLTLSGHEMNLTCSSSGTALRDFVDNVLGKPGQLNPEPPALWAFPDNFFPSTGITYSSVPGTNVGGGSVDQIYFTNTSIGTVYLRSIIHGGFASPITPPPASSSSTYSDSSSSFSCEVSVNGVDFFSASGTGRLQLSITNQGPSGNATVYGTAITGMTNIASGPFGSFLLRTSQTKIPTGQHVIINSSQGSYIASYLDTTYEISVDAGNTWVTANRLTRLGVREPACGVPGEGIYATRNGSSLTLSWSNPSYSLQGSTNLSPPFWTTLSGGSPFVFNTATNGDRFFRLICP
jgi:hypothetical protein